MVLGRSGHHSHPEGETSQAHMRHLLLFPYSCRVDWTVQERANGFGMKQDRVFS